jgi:cobyrinic acid a,c-diamide synthase
MLDTVKDFHDDYGVIYAECGGLMYLMDQLEYQSNRFEMCGVIKGSVRFGEKRVVNYVEGEFQKDCYLGKKGDRFKGHEFHHSKILLEDPANTDFAYKILRGEGIKDGMDGIISKNCLASFSHLHAASYTEFAENFVKSAIK